MTLLDAPPRFTNEQKLACALRELKFREQALSALSQEEKTEP